MKYAPTLMAAFMAALWTMPAVAQHADHTGHEGHDMSGMDMPDTAEAADMSASAHTDHAGHAMPMEAGKPVPRLPPPPKALSGPVFAADAYYPDGSMGHVRMMMAEEMGGLHTTLVMLDRFELQSTKGADGFAWEGAIRTGGDIDRLWIKTEGEGAVGVNVDEAEIQALWGHAIGAWFDLQAGVRHDFGSGADRTQLALGVQGLAPYMFEVSAAAFLSTKGEVTARVQAETDQRLTQRLILQPRMEANFSVQEIPEMGVGTGLTSLHAGVRLRYEFRREFAPYVGLELQKEFGNTARMTRAAGDDPDRLVALVGIRAWL